MLAILNLNAEEENTLREEAKAKGVDIHAHINEIVKKSINE